MEKRIQKLNESELEKVTGGGETLDNAVSVTAIGALGLVSTAILSISCAGTLFLYKFYKKFTDFIDKAVKAEKAASVTVTETNSKSL